MRGINHNLLCVVSLLLFLNISALAATSSIRGKVADAATGQPLLGANVLLVGTVLGAVTDGDGRYIIPDVPQGTYTMRATYLGYRKEEKQITVTPDSRVESDFKLEPVGIRSKEVVVTGQASGQNQAINTELTANQIVNAVSAARIQELPDQNAAESVGRLPGISVLRNGGEGTEVVIRGLAPKYNNILIDGIQMASSNPNDRSTDLSGISSNMLGGIKVYKTVTPDMDANVIGGTVDFDLREAEGGHPGTPRIHLLAQGGYKGLSDAYNKFNNYKYVGTAEERFFGDRFGILAQVDIERENLTSNELGASYNHLGNSQTQYVTTGLTLSDNPRDIQRRNAALVIDYRLPEGEIKLTNFLSSTISSTQARQQSFAVGGNSISWSLGSSSGKGLTLINGIEFKNTLSVFQVDARFSHAYSQTSNSYWGIGFYQPSGAGLSAFNNQANVNPEEIPKAATYDLPSALIEGLYADNYFSKSSASTGSLGLKTSITFSRLVNLQIKFGGMYRYQPRYYNQNVYDGGGLQFGGSEIVNDLIISWFNLSPTVKFRIPMTSFLDPSFSYGKFLGGNYQMVAPLSYAKLSRMANLLQDSLQYITANHGTQSYGYDVLNSTSYNYSGYEGQSAFYLMGILNIGSNLTIIPGVRYQDLRTAYKGIRGIETRSAVSTYTHYDTTVVQNHGYYLPDVSLRYKPLSWFDIRLSYTHTLSYPDYSAIIPRIDVGTAAIAWNNFRLVPSRSTNYDAYFSFYDNAMGLFTIGGFWKNIRDLIYPWTLYASGANAEQYFPYSLLGSTSPLSGTYQISTTINDSDVINDYGIELDWETHFWYLPGVLSGLLLNVNYSHIFSKAQYPYLIIESTGRSLNYIDTSFTDRLLYQPDNLFNLSLGFDYQAFSIRVSWLYQDNIFTGPSPWPQLRSYTAAYSRWDLECQQGLPWFGAQVYGDLYNINGANDVSVIQGGGVPMSEQDYGMTGDLGVRFRF